MSLATAIEAIDAAHAADPDGKELAYADSCEKWLQHLLGDLDDTARLAARCQHLERWSIPRDSYPEGRASYLKWRKAVHARQGERACELITAAGVDTAVAERVRELVAKRIPRSDPLSQALEDAACLVFLDEQIDDFLTRNAYSDEKCIDIIRKTWNKMGEGGHAAALTLDLSPRVGSLVQQALA